MPTNPPREHVFDRCDLKRVEYKFVYQPVSPLAKRKPNMMESAHLMEQFGVQYSEWLRIGTWQFFFFRGQAITSDRELSICGDISLLISTGLLEGQDLSACNLVVRLD